MKRVDGASYPDAAWFATYTRMVHGSNYNEKVGTISAGQVAGYVDKADNGAWTLIVDYSTNTTLWLDVAETAKASYVSKIYGKDGDIDGFDETYVELYLGNLPPLVAGESSKVIELTTTFCPARTSSITFTSLTNATGISTTAYSYKTTTGYMGGFTEGDLAKLAKVVIDCSNTGNETYPDLQYFMLTHFKIGPYTWTGAEFGSYDLANKRYLLEFGDQINSAGGRDFYDPKNGGTLWAPYELKAYCKFPSGSKVFLPKITFYFYKPDGTLTSAFIEYCSFTS